jgi:tetratricopeptide (TPR) repeat protein
MESKYTEIIDKYLNGELKGEELEAFKKRLAEDKQLRDELALEEDLNKMILENEDVIEFRKVVGVVRDSLIQDKEMNSSEKIKNLNSKSTIKWYLIAASIIIIAGLAGYFYILSNNLSSNDRLFAQYYRPLSSDMSYRSESNGNDLMALGLSEYEDKNYLKAISYLSSYIKSDSNNYSAYLFLGISYIEVDSLQKAIDNFKIIIDNNNNPFIDYATWYLALTYIKTGNKSYKKSIQTLLGSLKDSEIADEAGKLLEQTN